MLEVIEFLKSEEMIVVYIVVAVASLLYFLIQYIDKFCRKRKQRQNTKELYRLVDDINNELKKEQEYSENINDESVNNEEAVYVEPIIENICSSDSIESEINENKQIFNEIKNELNDLRYNEQEAVLVKNDENIQVIKDNSNEDECLITINNSDDVFESNIKQIEISKEPELIVNDDVRSTDISHDDLSEPELLDVCDEISYTDSIPTITDAQEELRQLTEALESASTSNNIDLTSYEEQQEKDAIISLDELIEKTKVKYENDELSLFDDEKEAPISLDDLERRVDASLEATLIDFKDESDVIKEEFESSFADYELKNEEYKNDPQIITSEFVYNTEENGLYSGKINNNSVVSPIYGFDNASNNDLELENTANYEKLDEEIKKTNEFLAALKELKSNL